jgi:hypothetical protein
LHALYQIARFSTAPPVADNGYVPSKDYLVNYLFDMPVFHNPLLPKTQLAFPVFRYNKTVLYDIKQYVPQSPGRLAVAVCGWASMSYLAVFACLAVLGRNSSEKKMSQRHSMVLGANVVALVNTRFFNTQNSTN